MQQLRNRLLFERNDIRAQVHDSYVHDSYVHGSYVHDNFVHDDFARSFNFL